MIGVDQSSPSSSRVANLTLVLGIGTLGEQVIVELRKLLSASENGHQLAVASWCKTDQETDAGQEAQSLLSNKNLEALERAGYQVPGRGVGQPPRLSVVYVVDLNNKDASQAVETVREEIKSRKFAAVQSIIALGAGQVADLLSSGSVFGHKWEFAVPISSQDRVAGARVQDDLVATVARIAFVMSVPDQPHFGSNVLGRSGASSTKGTHVVRIGGAFLDSGRDVLVAALSKLIARHLLVQQFENPEEFQPAIAFDDKRRTKSLTFIQLDSLSRRLLADTPFAVRIDEDEVWHIELPPGIVAGELNRVPRRRWIAVLQKLRDLFDFTKARRWADSVERSEATVLSSVQQAIAEDVRQLHHYERGPDRILAWASTARNLLEVQPEIVRPPNADIDGAIEELRRQILNSPNTVAVWARVVLLGWIGAEGVRHIIRALSGNVPGWIGFTTTLAIAAILGFRLLERSHQSLHKAREAAQDALIRRYEAQMRENLSLVLNRVRSRLIAALDDEIAKLQNQAKCVSDITASMVGELCIPTANDLVNVEWIIPSEFRQKLLESLNLPWLTLVQQAADQGAFVPDLVDGEDCMKQTLAQLVGFSSEYLQSRLDEFGLDGLLEFRSHEDPGFEERIVRDMDRRAIALAGRTPLRTSWQGPEDVLTRLHDKIVALDADVQEHPSVSGMVACLKVGGNAAILSGGSE